MGPNAPATSETGETGQAPAGEVVPPVAPVAPTGEPPVVGSIPAEPAAPLVTNLGPVPEKPLDPGSKPFDYDISSSLGMPGAPMTADTSIRPEDVNLDASRQEEASPTPNAQPAETPASDVFAEDGNTSAAQAAAPEAVAPAAAEPTPAETKSMIQAEHDATVEAQAIADGAPLEPITAAPQPTGGETPAEVPATEAVVEPPAPAPDVAVTVEPAPTPDVNMTVEPVSAPEPVGAPEPADAAEAVVETPTETAEPAAPAAADTTQVAAGAVPTATEEEKPSFIRRLLGLVGI